MKTPIQELFEKYGHLLPDVEKEYLEKEKQQIINAYDTAVFNAFSNSYKHFQIGKEYYRKF